MISQRTAQLAGETVQSLIAAGVYESQIVGAVRRGEPYVETLDIIVRPRMKAPDYYDAEPFDLFEDVVDVLVRTCVLEWRGREPFEPRATGRRYYALGLPGSLCIRVWPRETQAAYVLACVLMTGPTSYARRVVAQIEKRGGAIKGGAVSTLAGDPLPVADELGLFYALNMPYTPAEDRR